MLKRYVFLFVMFFTHVFCYATTETISWYVDDNVYTTTTCESGGDLTLPNAPTKTGYNFVGWAIPKYIPLEYIENVPGDSYLNTNFYPTEKSKLVVDMVKTYNAQNETCPSVVTSVKNFGFDGNSRSDLVTWHFTTNVSNYNSAAYNRVTHSISKDGYYANGVKKHDTTSSVFSSQYPLFIFSYDENNVTSCVIRIYSIQLYQNDVLVHDYVPAMKPDGTVCLYDKVTDSFLYNSGSQPLVAGPTLDYD